MPLRSAENSERTETRFDFVNAVIGFMFPNERKHETSKKCVHPKGAERALAEEECGKRYGVDLALARH